LSPAENADSLPMRFPVQLVARHGGSRADDFRGYMGQVASGVLRRGDDVVILPAGVPAVVQDLVTFDGSLEQVQAGAPVTVVLDRDVDVSRGDTIVHAVDAARTARRF